HPHRAERRQQEPVRWDLGGLLLDQPCEFALGMFGPHHRCRRLLHGRLGCWIDIDVAHTAILGESSAATRMNLVTDQLQPATTGTGPLLQRDYWAVLAECSLSPSALMQKVKAHFCELPPTALVEFAAPDGVALNRELDIVIRPGQ